MSLSDLLNSTGGKSFKFDSIGVTVTGTVVSAEVVQKRNFDTGEPEFWSDGKPQEQVRITVSTTLRDPDDPEDEGLRSVYIKGWGDDLRALKAAIKAANAKDVEVGGTFTATYTGDGQVPAGKRGFPPKIKAYTYVRPSATAAVLTDQPAASGWGGQQAPVPATPAGPPALTPEQLAAFAQFQAQQAASQPSA